jgi:hypothetical protein
MMARARPQIFQCSEYNQAVHNHRTGLNILDYQEALRYGILQRTLDAVGRPDED